MAKKKTYSLYEAKTQLSAIVRRVREGDSVVFTMNGLPVAEIRPIPAAAMSLEARYHALALREPQASAVRRSFVRMRSLLRTEVCA